jgi:hypothetical protein
MQRPPRALLLENVAGFVGSQMHAQLLSSLAGRYDVREYLVSPHQSGVPYSRCDEGPGAKRTTPGACASHTSTALAPTLSS